MSSSTIIILEMKKLSRPSIGISIKLPICYTCPKRSVSDPFSLNLASQNIKDFNILLMFSKISIFLGR